jgi:excinuclease ABC subunit C
MPVRKRSGNIAMLARRLRFTPSLPGVYLMRDAAGVVIYVGKAKNLRRRLRDYFGGTRVKDPKLAALLEMVADFEIHPTATERDALLLEEKLIGNFLPRFNVSLRQGRRRFWITVDRTIDVPRLQVVGRRSRLGGDSLFGPYSSYAVACWLVRWLNRHFGLRSCLPVRPGPEDYRHCLEPTVNGCSAPCVGGVTVEEYATKVDRAVQWLAQPRWRLVRFLREEMKLLATARQFEKAAQYRDALACLQDPGSQLPPRGIRLDSEMAAAQQGELRKLLNLEKLCLLECFDISHLNGQENVASMVRFRDGLPEKNKYRYFRLSVQGANDYACMREAVERRYRRGEHPDLIVVDGGLPQLAAAQEALAAIGCGIKVMALAKEDERLYFTDGTNLKLPHDSPALHLVQRIRDEAHRRANGYTKLRQRKKTTQSLLDSVPGLSPGLKRGLLDRFGSVARMRNLGVSELMQVSGVGARLAEKIRRLLQEI